MVVLGADKKRDGSFIEASTLTIPLFDAVECRFSGKVEHEQDCNSIIANKWQHVHEFPLPTKIPNGEGDLSIPYGNGLLHEIHTWFQSTQPLSGSHAGLTYPKSECSLRPNYPRRILP